MRGHIGKKKSTKNKSGYRYYPVVFMGFDEKGKKKYKWHSGYDTQKEAQGALNKILRDLNTGAYVEPTKETLSQFMDRWLEFRKSDLRYKTHRRYEQLIRNQINPGIGHVKLSSLKPRILEEFYLDLTTKSGLSGRSVLHVHRLLHTALEKAVAWELIVKNPTDVISAPKAQTYDAQIWTPEQVLTFWEQTKESEPRYWIAYAIAIMTGLRREEILGLQWKDIDWEHEVMYIRRSLDWRSPEQGGKRVPVFDEVKSHRSRRPIELSPLTIQVLKEQKTNQAKLRLQSPKTFDDHDLIVTGPFGKPMNQDTLAHAWQRALKITGVPRIRFHDLRHTHSSLMMALGADIKALQERMGHSTPTILLNTYTHSLRGQQRKTALQLDDLIFKNTSEK